MVKSRSIVSTVALVSRRSHVGAMSADYHPTLAGARATLVGAGSMLAGATVDARWCDARGLLVRADARGACRREWCTVTPRDATARGRMAGGKPWQGFWASRP